MITSVIGTRPQYVKVKPVFYYCRSNGIPHRIIDSRQHYSADMSSKMIEDLGLKIDIGLDPSPDGPTFFMAQLMAQLSSVLNPDQDRVLVYGDTNTSFVAATVCKQLGIPFGHVEAGVRCGSLEVPEEVNRIHIDNITDLHFCTRPGDTSNVKNGIFTGDLEIEYLNDLKITLTSEDFFLMTIHRQENMTPNRMQLILHLAGALRSEVIFPIHHRLKMQTWFHRLVWPRNVQIYDPLKYSRMVQMMASCRGILTDSGSIQKTSAFFGKPTLVMRGECGWSETIDQGFARLVDFGQELQDHINFVSQGQLRPNRGLYLPGQRPSSVIVDKLIKYA